MILKPPIQTFVYSYILSLFILMPTQGDSFLLMVPFKSTMIIFKMIKDGFDQHTLCHSVIYFSLGNTHPFFYCN